jgi:hypothetical protein
MRGGWHTQTVSLSACVGQRRGTRSWADVEQPASPVNSAAARRHLCHPRGPTDDTEPVNSSGPYRASTTTLSSPLRMPNR